MNAPLTTVVVVPRERFSLTQRSLESVVAHTPESIELIYVDGGSPPHIREYLEQQAALRQFRLIRTEHHLTPNMARNLALPFVRTRYVTFVDNDALVSPNWLPPLVDCAEKTGAWVVGPIYCEREPIASRIHMAGGTAEFVVENGRRTFREEHRCYGQSLSQVRPTLRRQPVDQIEFHCALVRMEAFDRLGPLDECLMSAGEHTDLCLMTAAGGGSVYLEPESVVTYLPPPPFAPSDLPFFRLRWGNAWNEITLERLREKWDLDADDPGIASLDNWLAGHRRLANGPMRKALKLLGRRPARLIEKVLVLPIEAATNRRQSRRYESLAMRRAA